MGVSAGCKETAAGEIPEGWELKPLGQITRPKREFRAVPEHDLDGTPCINLENIQPATGALTGDPTINAKAGVKLAFARGDVLFGRLRAYQRKYWLADRDGFCSTEFWVLAPGPSAVTPRFLYNIIETYGFAAAASSTYGTHMPRSDWAVAQRYLVRLPPEPEQRAIAAMLTDADELLAALERLIAKKRDVKQAVTQQLLTGKTRLPGFAGEWKCKKLGEIFTFTGGHAASRDQLSSKGHCYLHYGDIHGATKPFIDACAEFERIPKLEVPLTSVPAGALLNDGDVVFVDASEDLPGTSRHIVVVNTCGLPFISGLHTIVAKSKTSELGPEFRRYCFQAEAVRRQFAFYAVGTKVSGISKANIARVTLLFPRDPAEQSAISAILRDIDAELELLERRLQKTRAVKQAMMQELLTGKTRLVAPAAANA